MNQRDSSTISPWQDTAFYSSSVATEKNDIYDVLIVGAGITGLTTALFLQQAGKKCVLAEARSIGFGTTGGTTAHLNTFFDATYPDIESDFDEETAKSVADAGKETLDMMKNLVDTYQIDCDFEYKDAFVFSENEEETKLLKDLLASSRKAGIHAIEERDNQVPVPFEMVIQYTDQAQFHPLKYISKLAELFIEAGGVLLENTFISKTTFVNPVHTAESGDVSISARHLVYATHLPPGINLLNFRCAPYRSYVLGVKLKNDDYPKALIYDMQEPYHYLRTHVIDGEPLLILGGEDHKTGHADPEAAFKALRDYAEKYYYVKSIPFQWSAQYYTSADGLPYIGQLPGGDANVYIATGYNGNGMIFGSLAGKLIADEIMGIKNKYAAIFNPSRVKPVAGFADFVKENADVAFHFFKDRLSVSSLDSLSDLTPGTGRIVDYQDRKVAIYKSEDGTITALNPVCTHAKCIVNFNRAEKSWDCPCHGGRFDVNGQVLTGPPRKNLEKIVLQEESLGK